MASKQAQIEQVVVGYFRQRHDTSVSYIASGVYRVELITSTACQLFGSGGSNRQVITLVFDSNMLSLYPRGELVSAGHRYFDVILNDLERDSQCNPRLAVAYGELQPISAFGEHDVPGMSLVLGMNSRQQISYAWHYLPSFILTYRVIYRSDQQSENIVRLAYDGQTGAPRPELLLRLDNLLSTESMPQSGISVSCIDLDKVLTSARKEIERRILPDLQTVGKEMHRILERDRQEAEKNYQEKLTSLWHGDVEGQRMLAEWHSKYIQDIERKYTCRTSVSLLSVLQLWWPVINYNITITGKRRKLFLPEIPYDSRLGRVNWSTCPKCGGHKHFNTCLVGSHVQCADCSSALLDCSVCGDSMCSDHGGKCTHCSAPVCCDDHGECAYGPHKKGTYFCPTCLTPSFEGKLLCHDCYELCAVCHRPFAHQHLRTCRIGHERICTIPGAKPDGFECQDCHETTCRSHGLATAEGTWVCRDHGAQTTCCKRIFALSRLARCCVDSREILCQDPKHRFHCIECGKSVCEKHSSQPKLHTAQRVCDTHRKTCSLCSSTVSYLKADLTTCVTCHKEICSDHGVTCQICGKTRLCRTHADHAPRCAGCGLLSCNSSDCSAEQNKCTDCGMSYCRHCCSQGGKCVTCAQLAISQMSDKSRQRLTSAAGMSSGNDKRDLLQMLEKRDHMVYLRADNRTYQVELFRWAPPLLNSILSLSSLSQRQARVVSEVHSGNVLSVRIEQVK